MKKMIALVSALAILMIAFSGCVGDNKPAANGTEPNNSGNTVSNLNMSEIKLKTVPANFSYDITLPLTVDEIKSDYEAENVSGILEGSRGIYKDSNKTEYHIDVIKLEGQEAANNFITAYKSSIKPLNNGSPFTNESINEHPAVKITKYVTFGGESVTRYSYIWNNENYVIVVYGNTAEEAPVRQLAEATGY
jgi:hypothetical protein